MTPPPPQWLTALPWLLGLAIIAWIVATLRRNVGLVDIAWPLLMLLGTAWYVTSSAAYGERALLVLVLTAIWSLRLATHLAVRNWNAPEDHRYQVIRRRNEPGFWWKSLYLVFALQAVMALIVIASTCVAVTAPASPLVLPDFVGAAVVLGGLAFEGVADAQLSRFLAQRGNGGKVMDQGVWQYSRHPNYFGEFCVWWGMFVIAAAQGGWWSVASPLLMSVLLLRVSGVTLLEKDIGHRRPGYAAYVAHTNAFFPGPSRRPQ